MCFSFELIKKGFWEVKMNDMCIKKSRKENLNKYSIKNCKLHLNSRARDSMYNQKVLGRPSRCQVPCLAAVLDLSYSRPRLVSFDEQHLENIERGCFLHRDHWVCHTNRLLHLNRTKILGKYIKIWWKHFHYLLIKVT